MMEAKLEAILRIRTFNLTKFIFYSFHLQIKS